MASPAQEKMVQRLWFGPVVDGLFCKALRSYWTPSLLAGLREFGIDLEKPLLPAYPAEDFARAIKFTAKELYALPLDEGMYLVGQQAWRGFTDTMVGKAMVTLLRVIGPRRTLPRSGRNFRSGTNYIEVVVTERAPSCFTVQFNDVDDIPNFFRGLMDLSGDDLGAPRKSSHALLRGKEMTLFIDLNTQPSPEMETLWQTETKVGGTSLD